MTTIPNILSIAGSDPSGGAGIQADLKSIAANGGFGMAAITALTAQNTQGVTGVHTPPAAFLRQQLETLAQDVRIDAVKIGMLGSTDIVATVQHFINQLHDIPVVLDPVMVATSGSKLLDDEAVAAVSELATKAELITPNIPEAVILAHNDPRQQAPTPHIEDLARLLTKELQVKVLVKGGHTAELDHSHDVPTHSRDVPAQSRDVLADGEQLDEFCVDWVETTNTHGTGCSLSSAIATYRGLGYTVVESVDRAKTWLTGALANADRLEVGHGPGPVHHTHRWF